MSNTYCLVHWINENRPGIVASASIATEEHISIGEIYLCKYGSAHYRAKVIHMGTNKACKDKLNELSELDCASRSRSTGRSSLVITKRSSSQKSPAPSASQFFASHKSPKAAAITNYFPSPTNPQSRATQSSYVKFMDFDGDLNGPSKTSQRASPKYQKFKATPSLEKNKFQVMFSSPIKNTQKQSTSKQFLADSPDTSLINLSEEEEFEFKNNADLDYLNPTQKGKTVRGLAKLNANSKTVFSKDERELENYVLREKLSEKENEMKNAKKELEKIKKQNLELNEKASTLTSIISKNGYDKIRRNTLTTRY